MEARALKPPPLTVTVWLGRIDAFDREIAGRSVTVTCDEARTLPAVSTAVTV
jgi:hypothetical protein